MSAIFVRGKSACGGRGSVNNIPYLFWLANGQWRLRKEKWLLKPTLERQELAVKRGN